jgi:hypothetical protein
MKKFLKNFYLFILLNKIRIFITTSIRIKYSNIFYKNSLKIIKNLNQYVPNTSGTVIGLEKEIMSLTLKSADQIFPFINNLQKQLGYNDKEIITAEEFCESFLGGMKSANAFKKIFDKYNSDKTLNHNYHFVYGPIINTIKNLDVVFEIGLGTTNTDIVSHMGHTWKPGASLRAFREYLPEAKIYGADIDKRILFNEKNIETFFIDQTDLLTFDIISNKIDTNIDLIIDDGLHSPNANIATLAFALTKISNNGWVVIEDISYNSVTIWKVISNLFPVSFKTFIIKAKNSYVFAITNSNNIKIKV